MPAAEVSALLRKLLTIKRSSTAPVLTSVPVVDGNQGLTTASAPASSLELLSDRSASSSASSLSLLIKAVTRSSSVRPRAASRVSTHSDPVSPSTIGTIASPTRKPSASSDVSLPHPQAGAGGLSDLKYLGTQCALSLEQVEAEIKLVSGVEGLIECLSLVFQAVEHARVNKVQWKLLQGRCVVAVRLASLRVAGQDQHHIPELGETTHRLDNTLRKVSNCARNYQDMDEVVEFLCFRSMSNEIQNFFSELDLELGRDYRSSGVRLQWEEEFRAVQEKELEELERVYRLLSTMKPGLGGTNSGCERPFGTTAGPNEELFNDGTKGGGSEAETVRSEGMSSQDMFQCLTRHGCSDLTQSVDLAATSPIPVASGGSGDVWQGSLYGGTVIAIKVWKLGRGMRGGDTKCLKKATRELYNWSKMNHENIHELLGVTMFHEQLGMVSTWMEKGNLQDYIQNNPNVDRYQLCIQTTKAVQYLHSKNRVHGDLKACNFLVSSDGTVKLTDFGNSVISDVSLKFSDTNSKGGGTLRWMAPELLAHTTHCRNKQTDIHALGMTLLEIITGALPYPQFTLYQHVFRALMEEILPECTNHFQDGKGRRMWSLLTQCWNRDPNKRPTANKVLILLILITETPYPQNQHSIVDSYLDAHQIVPTILAATRFYLPPKLIMSNKCTQDVGAHIKDGSTCYVYVADLLGGIQVAKKVFKIEKEKNNRSRVKNYAEHLTRVATLWNNFRSEYLLPIYGIGLESLEGDKHFRLYMLTPFLENLDAMSYLETRRDNEGMKKTILRIITDAALGLQYLHGLNSPVVHSGMRGDNIFVTGSGRAVLGEFGLTKALECERDGEIPQAVTKSRKQSRRWVAPELINHQVNSPFLPQISSGVWGWGMAALEITSGSRPYHSCDDILVAMRKVIEGPPVRGDHAKFETYAWRPNETWELFNECWSNEPSERPVMNDVVLRLKEISDMTDDRNVSLAT